MSNESRSEGPGVSFVLKWGFLTASGRIIAVILGSLFAAQLTLSVANFIHLPNDAYFRVFINNGFKGLLIALAIGGVQWLLLRKRLQGAINWFIVLLIGEILGLTFIVSFRKLFVDRFVFDPGIIIPLVISPIIGFLIALAQGNILRKNNYSQNQWLWVVPVVWLITQYFNAADNFSMASSPYLNPDVKVSMLITGIVFLLIGSILQGAIEGIVLARVLKQQNKSF